MNVLQSVQCFLNISKKKQPDNVTLPEFDLPSDVAPSSIEFNKTLNDFGGAAGRLFVSY